MEIGGETSGIFPVELLPGDSSGKAAFAQFSEGKSLWEWPLQVSLTRREESCIWQSSRALLTTGSSCPWVFPSLLKGNLTKEIDDECSSWFTSSSVSPQ